MTNQKKQALYGGDMALGVVYGPSGMGKCLAGTAEIVLADGTVRMVKSLVDSGELASVLSLHDDYKIRPAKVSAYYRNGQKPVVRVKTASGRRIDVTVNHPLLGAAGWIEAGAFEKGDLIAVPREIPVFGEKARLDHEVDFLALYLADGTFDSGTIRYTNTYEEKIAAMRAAVARFGGLAFAPIRLHGGPTITYQIKGADGKRQTHAAHKFLRDAGLEEKRAADKFLPDWVFSLPKKQLARFLSLYLGSDGGYEIAGRYSFSSASERMLRQVSHLLLRFGVRGIIRTKLVKGVTYWEWVGSSADTTEILRTEIRPIGKEIPFRQANRADTRDALPIQNRDVSSKRSWPDSPISRYSAQRLPYPAPHVRALAFSDIYWDRVAGIEDLGMMETFDLTVPGPHNFIADDVFAHNTTDLLYSFPRGLFVAQPGALKPAYNVVGFVPAQMDAQTIDDATAVLKKEGKSGKYDSIIVDDFSLLAERTFSKLESKGGNNGFKLWGALRDSVIDFRDTARECGMHVVLSAHESAPTTKDGRFIRGGPKLPGKMPEDFPTVCDLVLRTALDKNRLGWHGVYRCSIDDPNYVTKDRHGVTPDPAPMNVAEILRLAGYVILRAPGLEWQEELVDGIATTLLDIPLDNKYNAASQEVAREAVEVARSQTDNDMHIRWVLRDGFDRAVLKRAQKSILATFGVK